MEFKHLRKEEELENTAKLALQQIQDQAYHMELLAYPYVKEVVACGIAFSGKAVLAAYATYDLVHQQTGAIMLTSKYSQEGMRSALWRKFAFQPISGMILGQIFSINA